MNPGNAILSVRDVRRYFPVRREFFTTAVKVRAVDGVSFDVCAGETVGLVGESGCGKTTMGKLIVRLEKPDSGEILFQGKNIVDLRGTSLRAFRRKMQIVFQDPFASLDPRKTVFDTVSEPLRVHRLHKKHLHEKVMDLLKRVGLSPEQARRYPHQFSGGQRQRIVIARALILNPAFLVADEPVSALDVSIQAQIINLLTDLQQELHLTYLFISHDLSVVRHISTRVAIMYLGKIVETAPTPLLFSSPAHPYTRALISAIPSPDGAKSKKRLLLKGDVPSPIDIPPGCRFHTRCPSKMPICTQEEPPYTQLAPGHFTACHLYP